MKTLIPKIAKKKSSSHSLFTPLIVGAAIGAGVALLTAPRSGKDTRKLLGKKAQQFKGKAERTVANAREIVNDRKAKLVSAMHSGKQAIHKASR